MNKGGPRQLDEPYQVNSRLHMHSEQCSKPSRDTTAKLDRDAQSPYNKVCDPVHSRSEDARSKYCSNPAGPLSQTTGISYHECVHSSTGYGV